MEYYTRGIPCHVSTDYYNRTTGLGKRNPLLYTGLSLPAVALRVYGAANISRTAWMKSQ